LLPSNSENGIRRDFIPVSFVYYFFRQTKLMPCAFSNLHILVTIDIGSKNFTITIKTNLYKYYYLTVE